MKRGDVIKVEGRQGIVLDIADGFADVLIGTEKVRCAQTGDTWVRWHWTDELAKNIGEEIDREIMKRLLENQLAHIKKNDP